MMEKRGHNAGRARTTGRVGTHTRWANAGAPADAAAPGRADLVGTRRLAQVGHSGGCKEEKNAGTQLLRGRVLAVVSAQLHLAGGGRALGSSAEVRTAGVCPLQTRMLSRRKHIIKKTK